MEDLRPISIAIVGCQEQQIEAYKSILTSEAIGTDLSLYVVESGNRAIELFEAVHPDMFLISTTTRGMPAKEVCRWVRAHEGERHTGIFMVSNTDLSDAEPANFLLLGADEYIRKSCTSAELIARIQTILRFKLTTDRLRTANFRLQQLILIDELTGLANMRGFQKRYADLIHQCLNGDIGLGVLMIDVDYFKEVNDTFNHLVGSEMIKQAGELIEDYCAGRQNLVAARYGGDEFIIALEEKSLGRLFNFADGLRRRFETHNFKVDDYEGINLTISLGASWVPASFRVVDKDLIKLADIMLYKSKFAGRNKVGLMQLRYPIDFDHICRVHRINRDAGSNDYNVARFYNTKVS